MGSKETCVAAPPSNTQLSPLPRTTRVCAAPDIQHLTPPGCNLCICSHVCMVAVYKIWRI